MLDAHAQLPLAPSAAMTSLNQDLPSFARPPVSEVVLALQFEPLDALQVHHFGLLWTDFRSEYPKVQMQPPLEPATEIFPAVAINPQIRFELQSFPLPRAWFLSECGDDVVQIQRDRFMHNWRKTPKGRPYPRYSELRRSFVRDANKFYAWCLANEVGLPRINQCEVSYVNQIELSSMDEGHGQPHRIASLLGEVASPAPSTQMESLNFAVRYIIGDKAKPSGRLHVEFAPAFSTQDSSPMFVVNLTARGAPRNSSLDAAMEFLDDGHAVIVNSFKSLTTKEMHSTWGLEDGR